MIFVIYIFSIAERLDPQIEQTLRQNPHLLKDKVNLAAEHSDYYTQDFIFNIFILY